MTARNPERIKREDEQIKESNTTVRYNKDGNVKLKGKLILKAGMKMEAKGISEGLSLEAKLKPYTKELKDSVVKTGMLTGKLTADVNVDISPELDLSDAFITGKVEIPKDSSAQIKRQEVITGEDGKPKLVEVLTSSKGAQRKEKTLTEAEAKEIAELKSEELKDESREDQGKLLNDILAEIGNIFGTDKPLMQKLAAVLTLVLDKLSGINRTNESSANTSDSTLESEIENPESENETVKEARKAVRSTFDLEKHQKLGVFDLRLNPFSKDKTDNMSDYLTYQAEKEKVKRLIVLPEKSTTKTPAGFETQKLDSFQESLEKANKDSFRKTLKTPMAIESELQNPGFVEMIDLMQTHINTPTTNTTKRKSISDNIERQFITESNPNSAIASRYLELFNTSG